MPCGNPIGPAVRGNLPLKGIATGHATFEAEVPDWRRFDESRLPTHRIVAEALTGGVLGWAAVSAVSGRPAYSGVVEHSVYVSEAARGGRIGTLLLEALVDSTESGGIWTIQASVFPENEPSMRLHLANILPSSAGGTALPHELRPQRGAMGYGADRAALPGRLGLRLAKPLKHLLGRARRMARSTGSIRSVPRTTCLMAGLGDPVGRFRRRPPRCPALRPRVVAQECGPGASNPAV